MERFSFFLFHFSPHELNFSITFDAPSRTTHHTKRVRTLCSASWLNQVLGWKVEWGKNQVGPRTSLIALHHRAWFVTWRKTACPRRAPVHSSRTSTLQLRLRPHWYANSSTESPISARLPSTMITNMEGGGGGDERGYTFPPRTPSLSPSVRIFHTRFSLRSRVGGGGPGGGRENHPGTMAPMGTAMRSGFRVNAYSRIMACRRRPTVSAVSGVLNRTCRSWAMSSGVLYLEGGV